MTGDIGTTSATPLTFSVSFACRPCRVNRAIRLRADFSIKRLTVTCPVSPFAVTVVSAWLVRDDVLPPDLVSIKLRRLL